MKKIKIAISLIIITVIISVGIYFCPTPVSTLSYYGSRGTEVTKIQTRLKDWGYYKGRVDGIYAYKTYSAVKWFQARNGLRIDGVAGAETLRALGLRASPSKIKTTPSSANAHLLAHLVHGEARGEPYLGKVAVAAVVLNRIENPRYPHTIPGVIYQPGAFTAVSDGQINIEPDGSSINAARDALNGWDPTSGCIYYFNPATATSNWIWSRPVMVVIGKHYFAK